ncbi:MAG TPA: WXG100 family type VII secretion target [Actinophytocola sp.]|jgi:WXG100 family type VII secretion target|nr:WXG100 family type VII secretion target [Actinophytocola sp.]
MAPFKVDLDRLNDIIDQIGQFDRRLESALEDADARVNRLHTTWRGEAAAQHRRAHEEWQRGVREMRAALATMRKNASIAHANYLSAVNTNTQMWEQVR